jgi:hypothetical protein
MRSSTILQYRFREFDYQRRSNGGNLQLVSQPPNCLQSSGVTRGKIVLDGSSSFTTTTTTTTTTATTGSKDSLQYF